MSMMDYPGPPGIVLTRDLWNGRINLYNAYTVLGAGLPLLPSNQTWLRQADITTMRNHIASVWPHHYFRHTVNPIGRMTAFNDLYDAGEANVLYNLPYRPPPFGGPAETGTEYIVYSKKWREAPLGTFDYFNMIAAGRAVPAPSAPQWWIFIYAVHTFTMMYHWEAQNVWFLADAGSYSYDLPWLYDAMHNYSMYDRSFYPPAPGQEGEEHEDTYFVDGRIPTIATAEDGTRRFVSPNTGGQYVLPPMASEPRTYFVLRITTWPGGGYF